MAEPSLGARLTGRDSILIQASVGTLTGGTGGSGGPAAAGGSAGVGGTGEGPRIIETLIVNNYYFLNPPPPPSASPTLRDERRPRHPSAYENKQDHSRTASDESRQRRPRRERSCGWSAFWCCP
ncbi:hypothetical protein B0H14DRAFT_3125992 [Mycena olivaceomarginata]|nr:hypothetical protein B0H14DRAFT_3125992 [Mycena olivaceomarginata]